MKSIPGFTDGQAMNEPKPMSARSWLIVVASLAAAWIVFLILFGPRSGMGDLPVPELKAPQPTECGRVSVGAPRPRGSSVSLEKYQGKTIFLNIWATWCPLAWQGNSPRSPTSPEMPSSRTWPSSASPPMNPRNPSVPFSKARTGQ